MSGKLKELYVKKIKININQQATVGKQERQN